MYILCKGSQWRLKENWMYSNATSTAKTEGLPTNSNPHPHPISTLTLLTLPQGGGPYICGSQYTIADMIIWPWYGAPALDESSNSTVFLDTVKGYPAVVAWAKLVAGRDAVKRGLKVNKYWGPKEGQLLERHAASDFENKTEDKVEAAKAK